MFLLIVIRECGEIIKIAIISPNFKLASQDFVNCQGNDHLDPTKNHALVRRST
jgi:hypothetical protein